MSMSKKLKREEDYFCKKSDVADVSIVLRFVQEMY